MNIALGNTLRVWVSVQRVSHHSLTEQMNKWVRRTVSEVTYRVYWLSLEAVVRMKTGELNFAIQSHLLEYGLRVIEKPKIIIEIL